MILGVSVRLQKFKQHIQDHTLMSGYIPNYFSMFCTYLYLKFSELYYFLSVLVTSTLQKTQMLVSTTGNVTLTQAHTHSC